MTSDAYRTLSNALEIALSRPASHWVSARMSAPANEMRDEIDAEAKPAPAPEFLEVISHEPVVPQHLTAAPFPVSEQVSGSPESAPAPAEPSQTMPRFLRDTLDLEDATASLRLLRLLNSASEKVFTGKEPDLHSDPNQSPPEKRGFKYYPEATLTCAALACLGVFFWLGHAPNSITRSEFSDAGHSRTISRLNFVGVGGCWGSACETLIALKSKPDAVIANERIDAAPYQNQLPQGHYVSASENLPADAQQANAVVTAPLPPGIILSASGDDFASQGMPSEAQPAIPAIMDQAVRVGIAEQAPAAATAETGEALPEIAHNLEIDGEPLPEAALQSEASPAAQSKTPSAIAPAKPKHSAKPGEPRRQSPAQSAQKPAVKAASKSAPKKSGIAQAVTETAPAAQKVAPASKASPPVVAAAKPSPEPSQSAQGDPAPGFQILNNLNNEFFSFQP